MSGTSSEFGDNASSTSLIIPEPLPERFSAIQGLFRRTINSFKRQILNQGPVDTEADLKAYQDEIDRLKTRTLILELRRDSLKVENHRLLLSPIRRMPLEILTHIFSFC
ncbi:hypothetical protein L218DRAFT_863926, partial [Marasmius fiardii PR-910]